MFSIIYLPYINYTRKLYNKTDKYNMCGIILLLTYTYSCIYIQNSNLKIFISPMVKLLFLNIYEM